MKKYYRKYACDNLWINFWKDSCNTLQKYLRGAYVQSIERTREQILGRIKGYKIMEKLLKDNLEEVLDNFPEKHP